jgi:hypothetical protein
MITTIFYPIGMEIIIPTDFLLIYGTMHKKRGQFYNKQRMLLGNKQIFHTNEAFLRCFRREFTCWHNDQNSFKMYIIMGNSVDTPYSLTYPDEIDNLADLQNQHPIFSNVNGDGTVPFTSAQADTNSIKYIYKGSSDHVGMMSNSGVISAIIGLLQNNGDLMRSQSMVEFSSNPTHNCVKTLPAMLIIGGGSLIIVSVPIIIITVKIVRRRRATYATIQ